MKESTLTIKEWCIIHSVIEQQRNNLICKIFEEYDEHVKDILRARLDRLDIISDKILEMFE